jgi:glutaminase
VRGVAFCKELVASYNFHAFDSLTVGEDTGKRDPRRKKDVVPPGGGPPSGSPTDLVSPGRAPTQGTVELETLPGRPVAATATPTGSDLVAHSNAPARLDAGPAAVSELPSIEIQTDQARPAGRRILVFVDGWARNNAMEVFNMTMCRGLAEDGHEVEVRVQRQPEAEVPPDVTVIGPPHGKPLTSPYEDVNAFLADLPEPGSVDMVIGHGHNGGMLAVLAARHRYTDAKCIHVIHRLPMQSDTPEIWDTPGKHPIHARNQLVADIYMGRHSDLVAAPGPLLAADALLSLSMAGRASILELPPSLMMAEQEPLPRPDAPERVLLIGPTGHPDNEVAAAPDIVRERRSHGHNTVLVTVGGDPLGRGGGDPEKIRQALATLDALVDDHALEVHPHTSNPDELRAIIRSATVVIMPSRREPSDLVVTEAIEQGVPVMLSSNSGAGQVLADLPGYREAAERFNLVEQHLGAPPSVATWTDRLAVVLGDLPAAWANARQLQERLASFTPKHSAVHLVDAALNAPRRPPLSGSPARARVRVVGSGVVVDPYDDEARDRDLILAVADAMETDDEVKAAIARRYPVNFGSVQPRAAGHADTRPAPGSTVGPTTAQGVDAAKGAARAKQPGGVSDIAQTFNTGAEQRIPWRKLMARIRTAGIASDDPRVRQIVADLANADDHDGSGLTMEQFTAACEASGGLIARALRGDLVVPDFPRLISEVQDMYARVQADKRGAVANYIPQLAGVNPEKFAIAICTVDGQQFSAGDAFDPFCVQSMCKPINYLQALELLGAKTVHEHVGREPSGREFNELSLTDEGLPHNPLINSGAIMTCSLLHSREELADRFDHVAATWRRASGSSTIGFNNAVYLSECNTADRNFALGHMMRERGAFPAGTDLLETLQFYFQCCSIELDTQSLGVVAATLANAGINPLTNDPVFKPSNVRDCLSLMSSCGMYDFSGEFAFTIGLPAKSGVAGGVMLVVPGVMGVCIWSPRLDSHGNSVRGVAFCKELVASYNFHAFDSLTVGEDTGKRDPRRK